MQGPSTSSSAAVLLDRFPVKSRASWRLLALFARFAATFTPIYTYSFSQTSYNTASVAQVTETETDPQSKVRAHGCHFLSLLLAVCLCRSAILACLGLGGQVCRRPPTRHSAPRPFAVFRAFHTLCWRVYEPVLAARRRNVAGDLFLLAFASRRRCRLLPVIGSPLTTLFQLSPAFRKPHPTTPAPRNR